ncbi:MAG: D-alanine--D-alanine ligase A [Holosporales bacterium]
MKKTVLLLFGGKSPEHEISVKTAYNVANAIDSTRFDVALIGVSRSGSFQNISFETLKHLALNHKEIDTESFVAAKKNKEDQSLEGINVVKKADVVFPLLHGVQGEDGIPQGFLEMLNIPYVGCDVKASSLCMDKDVTKRILKSYGIPVVPSITLRDYDTVDADAIIQELGLPLFVKAAEQGSSIGCYKAVDKESLLKCMKQAFLYGRKVLIEKAIDGREIECAILGNDDALTASCLGEIIPSEHQEFYTYDAKYMDPNGAKLIVDVKLNGDLENKIKAIAKEVFKNLDCSGLSRIDFFLTKENHIYLNEVNTMPGFTSISMYPTLIMQEGFTYSDIISKLIDLSLEKFLKKQHYSLV